MKLAPDEFTGRRYGKYEVLCRLAVGGMAEIFLGFARGGPFIGKPVVLKNILPEQREDPVALQMLLDEARVTATLSHPNVAQVIDLERTAEDVLMVIEFIEGANLEEIVEAWKSSGEAVPLGYALAAVKEAAQGLSTAHQHKDARGQAQPIVHRDVTPRNVMTSFQGATKMLDFGIARAMGSQRRTVAGMVRGTTAYMSPEQAIGKDLDPRSDLFSIGVIFHELLTGQRLFFRGNPGAEMAAVYEAEIPLPSRVNRRVPKQLDAVVMRALDRNRDRRYQTAVEFVRDLSAAAGASVWPKERCAEMVRERFADRERNLGQMLARIPRLEAVNDERFLTLPERSDGRTVRMQQPASRGVTPGPSFSSEQPAKTLIESGPELAEARERARRVMESWNEPPTGEEPQIPRAPPMPVEAKPSRMALQPVGTQPVSASVPTKQSSPTLPPAKPSTPPQPQPARPLTPPQPQPAKPITAPPASLDADSLFADLPEERTKLLTNGPRSVKNIELVPTNPATRQEPRPTGTSRTSLVLAAIFALLIGAGGGALIYSKMGKLHAGAQLGRLSLKSDRPVAVVLAGQSLGQTPIDSWLPAGTHSLQLIELDGTTRTLTIEVGPGQVVDHSVALDSLAKQP